MNRANHLPAQIAKEPPHHLYHHIHQIRPRATEMNFNLRHSVALRIGPLLLRINQLLLRPIGHSFNLINRSRQTRKGERKQTLVILPKVRLEQAVVFCSPRDRSRHL